MDVSKDQFAELLLQMLETEQGGVKVYETALRCVQNDELKEEWEKYLAETTQHVEIVTGLVEHFGGDPDASTPGRLVVRHIGQSLVKAMEMALKAGGPPEAAQLVAAECVVHAETKDHLNWELLGEAALKGGKCVAIGTRPGNKSKNKRTSTCITAPAGAASFGSSRWAYRPCCRRPRRKRMSRRRSARPAPRRLGERCCRDRVHGTEGGRARSRALLAGDP